jgi:biopolymer transport protein ExbB/TolQ
VARSENRNSFGSMLGSLAWPLILGGAATAGFYALIYYGPLDHPLAHRYFAGHPINKIETGLFFIGLSALALKLLDLIGQYSVLSAVSLGDDAMQQPASKAADWLDALVQLPARARSSYLGRRLNEALEAVKQRNSAEALVEDLKYLSDVDGDRAHDSYGLARIVIWATPMLGFLGTVVGITAALGDLGRELGAPAAGDSSESLNTAMQGLLSGLYVAFDTTAIALCFSIVLMFIQFLLDRSETQLLAAVDERALEELGGRFELLGSTSDPNVAAIQRTAQAMMKSTESLVQRQAELWQQTIAAAHDQWQRVTRQTTEQMQTALAGALSQSLSQHAAQLAKSEQASAEQLQLRWEQWQTALSHNARLLHAQQQEMVKQGELMTQAIRVAGDVVQLERALNDNLSALAGSKNFEDTVMSLAAAIHLLNSRLGKLAEVPHVELRASQVKGRAA